MLRTISMISRSATSTTVTSVVSTSTTVSLFSSRAAPAAPLSLNDLRLRIASYGSEKFPLNALASVKESVLGGFIVTPYDSEITMDVSKSLKHNPNLKVFLDGGALRVIPTKGAGNVSWKTQKRIAVVPDARLEGLYDTFAEGLDDEYAPISSKLQMRLSKAWAPVDTKARSAKALRAAAAKAQLKAKKREMTAAMAVQDLNENPWMSERLERLASSNKKKIRQLLKKASKKASESLKDHLSPRPAW